MGFPLSFLCLQKVVVCVEGFIKLLHLGEDVRDFDVNLTFISLGSVKEQVIQGINVYSDIHRLGAAVALQPFM